MPCFLLFLISLSAHLVQTSSLFDDIDAGAEFFFSEEDYLSPEELSGAPRKVRRRRHSMIKVKIVSAYSVKSEDTPGPSRLHTPISSASSASSSPDRPSRSSQKRPRRSAAQMKSYVVPDSDDEEIVDVDDVMIKQTNVQAKKRKEESNMQKWIKHLSVLLKEEQRRFNEKKKRAQASLPPGTKVRFTRVSLRFIVLIFCHCPFGDIYHAVCRACSSGHYHINSNVCGKRIWRDGSNSMDLTLPKSSTVQGKMMSTMNGPLGQSDARPLDDCVRSIFIYMVLYLCVLSSLVFYYIIHSFICTFALHCRIPFHVSLSSSRPTSVLGLCIYISQIIYIMRPYASSTLGFDSFVLAFKFRVCV